MSEETNPKDSDSENVRWARLMIKSANAKSTETIKIAISMLETAIKNEDPTFRQVHDAVSILSNSGLRELSEKEYYAGMVHGK